MNAETRNKIFETLKLIPLNPHPFNIVVSVEPMNQFDIVKELVKTQELFQIALYNNFTVF